MHYREFFCLRIKCRSPHILLAKGCDEMVEKRRPKVPFGLGYALAENSEALNYFASLSDERQKEYIENSRGAVTKLEMRNYVEKMTKGQFLS